MKHQITLIGGQSLPVYIGVMEKNPDVVHVLYSKDSKEQYALLKNSLPTKVIHSYQIDPFNYEEIKAKAEEIIFNNDKDDFELNITGGTKIMAIACQQVFNDLKFPIFYIDQKHVLFDITDKKSNPTKTKITIDTFLKISGHTKYQIGKLSDFTTEEINLSEFLLSQMNSGWYWKAHNQLYKKGKYVTTNSFNFTHNNVNISWDGKKFEFNNNTKSIVFNSKKALDIAFTGLWWEILIGKAVSKWSHAYEFKMNLIIKSKVQVALDKNEIDIVLNTGKNLIFIECKAGDVTQDDINKIKAVSELYGGISSRSILVSRKKPSATILEKCQELGIDVFSQVSTEKVKNSNKTFFKFTNLADLPKRLDYLLTKLQL
ncbi:MAG TPA: DUF1887 family CARF protein [Bacteroidia bacterium]|jgi:hypothetical protein|nr:DUF1887 family CARF protein [Bacteroidia bacterium]